MRNPISGVSSWPQGPSGPAHCPSWPYLQAPSPKCPHSLFLCGMPESLPLLPLATSLSRRRPPHLRLRFPTPLKIFPALFSWGLPCCCPRSPVSPALGWGLGPASLASSREPGMQAGAPGCDREQVRSHPMSGPDSFGYWSAITGRGRKTISTLRASREGGPLVSNAVPGHSAGLLCSATPWHSWVPALTWAVGLHRCGRSPQGQGLPAGHDSQPTA